jgi:hypothetical protein
MLDDVKEADTMQLRCDMAKLSAAACASPARCPTCGDWMVAPLLSEFVEGDEIRHHWVCEGCGDTCRSTVPLADE